MTPAPGYRKRRGVDADGGCSNPTCADCYEPILTHTEWLPDGLGNYFALIRYKDGVKLVSTDNPERDTPEWPECNVLTMSPTRGIVVHGANVVSPYPPMEELSGDGYCLNVELP